MVKEEISQAQLTALRTLENTLRCSAHDKFCRVVKGGHQEITPRTRHIWAIHIVSPMSSPVHSHILMCFQAAGEASLESPPNFAEFDADRKKRTALIKEGMSSKPTSVPSAKRIKLASASAEPPERTPSPSLILSENLKPRAQQSEHSRTSLLTILNSSSVHGSQHVLDDNEPGTSVAKGRHSVPHPVTPPPKPRPVCIGTPHGTLDLTVLSSSPEIISARAPSSESDFLFLGAGPTPDSPTPKGQDQKENMPIRKCLGKRPRRDSNPMY